MAKKIIILEKLENDLSFRAAFWAVVPVARKPYYANASATSQYKDISAGELTSLQDGSLVEKVDVYNYASGTAIGAIQADLISKYNDFQSSITNFNSFQRYGTNWDGTSWTAGGVA